MSKIYVASSWRNEYYPRVISALMQAGHEVWDWRNPPTGSGGFKWQDVGMPDYKHGDRVSYIDYIDMIEQPRAIEGFQADFKGMQWCDIGVLLLPSGRSAHIEAGWIRGQAKALYVIRPEDDEPDLMHKLASAIFQNADDLIGHLKI